MSSYLAVLNDNAQGSIFRGLDLRTKQTEGDCVGGGEVIGARGVSGRSGGGGCSSRLGRGSGLGERERKGVDGRDAAGHAADGGQESEKLDLEELHLCG